MSRGVDLRTSREVKNRRRASVKPLMTDTHISRIEGVGVSVDARLAGPLWGSASFQSLRAAEAPPENMFH